MIIRAPFVAARLYLGPGAHLSGTTSIAGAPDTPIRRRVQLVHAADNAHGTAWPLSNAGLRVQWSDANGNWRFEKLDPAKKYHVIAYDHTGQHDPVIKLNLVPSMEE